MNFPTQPRFAGLSLQNFSTSQHPLAKTYDPDDDDPLNPYEHYTVKTTDADRETYKSLFHTSDTLTFAFGANCNAYMKLTSISPHQSGAPNQLPQARDKRQEALRQVKALFTQLLPEFEQLKVPAHLGFLAQTQGKIVTNMKWLVQKMC